MEPAARTMAGVLPGPSGSRSQWSNVALAFGALALRFAVINSGLVVAHAGRRTIGIGRPGDNRPACARAIRGRSERLGGDR